MIEPGGDALWDRAKTAEFLGISRATLATWAVRRKGPRFVKVGARVRYFAADVMAYLRGRTVEGESGRPAAQPLSARP